MPYICDMTKINSRLHKLSADQINSIVENTILWCQENVGVNNRRKNPFQVRVDTISIDAMGEFNYKTNTIAVYTWVHFTPAQLIRTLLHEYTHYMQPIRSYYNKMARVHKYYSRHPMERQAVRMERLYKMCWEDIRKKVQ